MNAALGTELFGRDDIAQSCRSVRTDEGGQQLKIPTSIFICGTHEIGPLSNLKKPWKSSSRLLIVQNLQPVHPMIAKLECQKWHRRAVDFRLRRSVSKMSSAKKLHCLLSGINHCRGFLFFMNAKACKEARKPDHLDPCLLCPQHEVPVQRKPKGFVDWSYPIPYVAAPEHCLLRNVSDVKESIGVVRRKDRAPNFRSLRVDKYSMSVDDVDVWPRLKNMSNVRERIGEQGIVAVQIGHDVAIVSGSLEAGINGVGLPGVRFATPADLPAISIQEINGAVLRGAILNMIRKGRVILPQNARHRCLQIFALVVARRYDCNPGWGIG